MNVLRDKVLKMLDDAHIQYELIKLPEGISLDVADHMKFHGRPIKYALATMVYVTEKGMVAVQRRGDTKVSSKKLREALGVKRLRLATPEELGKMGLTAGLVPPVALDIPLYADKKMLELTEIYTGAADNEYGMKTTPKELFKVSHPTMGDFAIYEEGVVQQRVLQGMRPTGRLHLGNYLGSAKGMVQLQNDPNYETYYMVADVHAITTPYTVAELGNKRRDVLIDYLSVGLDPEKSALFFQSMVPEHAELSFYLSSVMTVARMQHLPTFKEKAKQYPEHVTMALLNYPILMAADILLYKASMVPVGLDQEPHMEVAREVARKMNELYGMDFPEPQSLQTATRYVPSLLGEGKMSKSVEGSSIGLTDDLATIKKRLAGAPTDSGKGYIKNGIYFAKNAVVDGTGNVSPSNGVKSLLEFVEIFEGKEKRDEYEKQYVGSGIRYGDLKAELAEAIDRELAPIRERRNELEARPAYVDKVIKEGAERAKLIASATVAEVKGKMGLG